MVNDYCRENPKFRIVLCGKLWLVKCSYPLDDGGEIGERNGVGNVKELSMTLRATVDVRQQFQSPNIAHISKGTIRKERRRFS